MRKPCIGYGIDVTILHEGSAVALLCKISDYRDDHYHHDDRETIPVGEFALEIKRLLSEGRLDHLPLAKQAVEAAFEEREKFDDSLKEVYKKYVIQSFKRFANNGRPL